MAVNRSINPLTCFTGGIGALKRQRYACRIQLAKTSTHATGGLTDFHDASHGWIREDVNDAFSHKFLIATLLLNDVVGDVN